MTAVMKLCGFADQAELETLASWMEFDDGDSLADTFSSVYRQPDPARGDARYGICVGARLVCHAAVRTVDLCTSLGRRRVMLIGSVGTAPSQRRQGLASALLKTLLEDATRQGLDAAILWSDQWSFYARLGFLPSGCQWEVVGSPGAGQRTTAVRPATTADYPTMHALHQQKRQRVDRNLADMTRLLAVPEMQTFVLTDAGGRVLAYACCGKGADMRGWWHEFGGTDEAVRTLLAGVSVNGFARLLLPDERRQVPARIQRAVPGVVALVRSIRGELGDFFIDGLDSI